MMKRIYILLVAFSLVTLCGAQLPSDGDWRNRLGNIDQQKAKELFPIVFSKSSPLNGGADPFDLNFYIKVKQLMSLAPYSDYYYYSGNLYEFPNSMYRFMLDSISDPAIRMMLVEDVVEQGKRFVDDMDSINVLRELNSATKGDPLTLPLAKIRRAHYNYMFAHDPKYYPAHLYDKEKAYNLYKEAFKEFLASKGDQGKELHAYYVREYYTACEDLYRSDEEKYYEQFLSDYQEIVQVCDKLLIPCYDDPDSLKENSQDSKYVQYRQYNSATNGVDVKLKGDTIIKGQFIEFFDTIPYGVKPLFKASGAGSADRLRTYFAARLEANRQNKNYLDNSIHLMYENKFTNDSVFWDYCKASYDLGKTYENCVGLASSAFKDGEKMRQYYMEALDLSSSEINKAQIRYLIASSLFRARPKYVNLDANGDTIMKDGKPEYKNYPKDSEQYESWQKDIFACNTNLQQMLVSSKELLANPSLDVRDYVAQAYYMLGDNSYWLAAVNLSMDDMKESLSYFQKAGELDMKARVINHRPVDVESRYGKAIELQKKLKIALAQRRANAKQQAEYEEYMRKKKAEEAFWNQK